MSATIKPIILNFNDQSKPIIMEIALYIIGGLLLAILLLVLLAPKNYHVKRSITINRTRTDVFNYLRYLKNQDEWSPWKKKDPNMKQEWVGEDGTVGFTAKWEGNKDIGVGP